MSDITGCFQFSKLVRTKITNKSMKSALMILLRVNLLNRISSALNISMEQTSGTNILNKEKLFPKLNPVPGHVSFFIKLNNF